MSVLEGYNTLMSHSSAYLLTKAADDRSLGVRSRHADRDAWEHLIDHKLIEWALCPERVADDDTIPPTRDVTRRAVEFARDFQRQGKEAPTRAAPNGDGGIAFEWDIKDFLFRMEFLDTGEAEFDIFRNNALIWSERHFFE